jgi:butyryl-CoA dehydrogenase
MSAFVVFKDTPGLSTTNHENKMGIRTSITSDVVLEDVRIPASQRLGEEGTGFGTAMKTLDMARTVMGCVAVGIAQRALDEGIAYTKTRCQFGRPVAKNQGLQFKMADMAIEIEAARQLVAHAFTLMQMGLPYTKESSMAKCFGGDVAVKCALEGIQLFGGYGYSREYPVEKLLRDAKIFQIFEGSNEIQRVVIANNILGRF